MFQRRESKVASLARECVEAVVSQIVDESGHCPASELAQAGCALQLEDEATLVDTVLNSTDDPAAALREAISLVFKPASHKKSRGVPAQ